mgnify:FL=1
MIFTSVPKEGLNMFWEDVSGMLAKAVNTSSGKFHIDDIYRDLEEGTYNLWLAIDDTKETGKVVAGITTRIVTYPNKKSLVKECQSGCLWL